MRGLALFLTLAACNTQSFRVSRGELQRLAATDPHTRGDHVRVTEEVLSTQVDSAPRVDDGTTILWFPGVEIGGGGGGGGHHVGGGGFHGGGGHGGGGGGGGGDGKGEAIAILVVAATALVIGAAIEGSRFDGYAKIHPMQPLHLMGIDGVQRIIPLAWLQPQDAAMSYKAIVRSDEGPWHPLERAPLDRAGFTYSMYGGVGTMRSAAGDLANGTVFTIQGGYWPTQTFGIQTDIFFGWRDNRANATMFESRYMLELDAMPIAAGIFHAGVYGAGGVAYRFEDAIPGGNSASVAIAGGAQLQLAIDTRLALTARFGVDWAHAEHSTDMMFGLSIY
ncbi:MAG TPA: hypothetical protein VGM88_33700 [Kofleriaceae bacterium]|jgi:hypothetical protein